MPHPSTPEVSAELAEGIRADLTGYLGSSPFATSISSDVHEAVMRKQLGLVPQPKGARGAIDGHRADGSAAYQMKYRAAPPRVEQELFTDLDDRSMILAGETPAGEQAIHTLIDYCRADGPAIRRTAVNGSARSVLALAIQQADERLASEKTAKGISGGVYLALTIHSRDEHRFAQAIQPLVLPVIDDLKCVWANAERRTAIGIDRKTGNRVIQWFASGGQVKLDILTDRSAFARFRVDWEVPV